MVKQQSCTYPVPKPLIQSAHKAVMPTTTILVPTVQIHVCQAVFGNHLLFRKTTQSVCRHPLLSIITNLSQIHVSDTKMEDAICQHSEQGTTQSSPIDQFLTVRINLIGILEGFFTHPKLILSDKWGINTGKGWTCCWLIQRLRATRVKKIWHPFLLVAPYSSGDLRPQNHRVYKTFY